MLIDFHKCLMYIDFISYLYPYLALITHVHADKGRNFKLKCLTRCTYVPMQSYVV